MTCDSSQFFKLYFRELEARGIEYVILHSYQEFPDKIPSDIDYAVPHRHLFELKKIQSELARKNGWALTQTLQHGVFAVYAVVVNLENPSEFLKLDACSSYARDRRFYLPEETLLRGRVAYRGFYVPAPAAEFIYVLAKVFAKGKPPVEHLPRLRELWSKDPGNAQKYFTTVFGETGKTLGQWFASPAEDWRPLGPVMLARNRFGPALMLREGVRAMKRISQPTGICIAVLGSDGAGKSTLLSNLRTLLEPCFRQQKTLHFRPQILQKRTHDDAMAISNPHGRTPRNAFSSCLRVIYYFLDHWLGWMVIVWPAKICSTLIVFDRDFDDLLVDQRRYRMSGTKTLVGILRRLRPRPQCTFILSAPAQVLHDRKPELPVQELKRQDEIFQLLAGESRRYKLVSAEELPDQVATKVWRSVVMMLAAREEERG